MDLVADAPLMKENLLALAWKYFKLCSECYMLATCDPVREQKKRGSI